METSSQHNQETKLKAPTVPWYLMQIPPAGTLKLGQSTIGDSPPPVNLSPLSKAALSGQIGFHEPPVLARTR